MSAAGKWKALLNGSFTGREGVCSKSKKKRKRGKARTPSPTKRRKKTPTQTRSASPPAIESLTNPLPHRGSPKRDVVGNSRPEVEQKEDKKTKKTMKCENSVLSWKMMLNSKGPPRGSAEERLVNEHRMLSKNLKLLGLDRKTHATSVDYVTIKDKHNTKPRIKFGIGPEANSQWHWFFVATMTTSRVNESESNHVRALEFKMKLDKFQLAQGSCKGQLGKRKFTYGCTGAKHLDTAGRKKRELIRLSLENDTPDLRTKRLAHAKEHQKNLTWRGRGTNRFVDVDGKEVFYSGMAIGAAHDWDYQDADFVEAPMVITGANRKERNKVKWEAQDVRWIETKTHQHRWEIDVSGRLELQPGSEIDFDSIRVGESVLIADQMATKLTPTSYHVALKGVRLFPGCNPKFPTTRSILETLIREDWRS
ncbi:hypothetical protein AAMO2058_001665000 [Amorphochlora amoebiformis]